MIDAYVKDTQEKNKLFHAVDNFESVQKKANWALKWLGRYVSVRDIFPCHGMLAIVSVLIELSASRSDFGGQQTDSMLRKLRLFCLQ